MTVKTKQTSGNYSQLRLWRVVFVKTLDRKINFLSNCIAESAEYFFVLSLSLILFKSKLLLKLILALLIAYYRQITNLKLDRNALYRNHTPA